MAALAQDTPLEDPDAPEIDDAFDEEEERTTRPPAKDEEDAEDEDGGRDEASTGAKASGAEDAADQKKPTRKGPGIQVDPKINASEDSEPYRAIRGGIVLSEGEARDDGRVPWRLLMGGYVRVRYQAIQEDEQLELFGRNDGFVLSNARTFFAGRLDNGLGFRLQFDLTGSLNNADTITPFQESVVRPRDAFMSYKPVDFVEFQLGQFVPPHQLESLLSRANLLFVNRSVVSRGVRRLKGDPVRGLGLNREVGVQATGIKFFSEDGNSGIGVSYAGAITNGGDASDTFNDNDKLAYYGRVGVHYSDILALGVAAYLNDITVQQDTEASAVDQFDARRTGFTADALVSVAGFTLLGSFVRRDEEVRFLEGQMADGTNATVSRGVQVQAGYKIPVVDIQPAYRFATFDPTFSFTTPADQPAGIEGRNVDALTYHTFGLNYVASTYPVTLMLNYTLANEQNERTINNDRFDVLVQLVF